MRKKFSSLLLALSMTACLLSGCGSADNNTTDDEVKVSQEVDIDEESTEKSQGDKETSVDEKVEQKDEDISNDIKNDKSNDILEVAAFKSYRHYSSNETLAKYEECTYEVDEKGNIVKMRVSDGIGSDATSKEYIYEYVYFENGDVNKITKKRSNDNILLYAVEYDVDGKLLKMEEYSLVSGHLNEIEEDVIYEYDKNGMLIKMIETRYEEDEYESEIYEYDDKGRCVRYEKRDVEFDDGKEEVKTREKKYTYESISTSNGEKLIQYRDGEIVLEQEFEYDTYGNVVKEISKGDGKNYENTWEYSYDEKGNVLKKILYTSTGQKDTEYDYDSSGRLLKIISYHTGSGSLGQRSAISYEYEYEYISVRNWEYIKPLLSGRQEGE